MPSHDIDAVAFARRLEAGGRVLAGLEDAALIDAWTSTVEDFRRSDSEIRRELEDPLAERCGLSRPGLAAALETVLAGVRRDVAEELFTQARCREAAGLAVVVLASNIPGMVVQPLLPALALRCPVLVKTSSSERLFAPAFLAELGRRRPEIGDAFAAVTWPGGDRVLEEDVFGTAARVVAYGGGETMRDLAARVGEKLIAHGPKLSFAVLGAEVPPADIVAGLARDIALFDQRGCLSVQAIFTAGDARALAEVLGQALTAMAVDLPPGMPEPAAAAQARQIRDEAEMRGCLVAPRGAPLTHGTVILESPGVALEPSPGLRLVRIYPEAQIERLPERLAPWSGRLQGAVLAGTTADRLRSRLEDLGVSRFAEPGRVQEADGTWASDGVPPLANFS